MDTLYSWNAKRAGGKITIEHSCGKVTGVDRIEPRQIEGVWQVVATIDGGNLGSDREFILGVGSAR